MDILHHNERNYFNSVEYTLRPIQEQAVWEGVLDKDSMWAYADQGSYKMTLRYTLKNMDKAREQSMELKKLVLEKFSNTNLYSRFVDSIVDVKLPEQFKVSKEEVGVYE